MNHDPDVFDEPDKFTPERWLKDDSGEEKDDLRLWTFGFGRRYVFVYDSYILVDISHAKQCMPRPAISRKHLTPLHIYDTLGSQHLTRYRSSDGGRSED